MITVNKSRLGMLWVAVFFLTFTVGVSQSVVAQQVISNPLHAFALNRDKALRIEGHLVAAFDGGIEVYDNYTGYVTARLGEVAVKSRLLKIQRADGGHPADLKVSAEGGSVIYAQSIEAAGD